jgi:X-Pro dipeptidyl-peptidase (S15 family)/X-Pro dipeptidyl-peptidase C-terminal non-catalytic domain
MLSAAVSVSVALTALVAPMIVAPLSARAADAVPTTTRTLPIIVRDGVSLTATVITPTTGTRRPLIVVPGTFAGDGVNASAMAGKMAARGFVAISYLQRGLGSSTGQIDLGGPKDVADVSDVITWALKNTPSDPRRVGIAAVSYGAGYLPMVVLKDSRVTAAAMVSGWGDMWSSRFPGNISATASNLALRAIGASGGRFSPTAASFFNNAVAGRGNAQLRHYAAVRSPSTYLDRLARRNVPLYVSTSMNEMIWPASQTMAFYTAYPGVKHLDVMPGDHANTELFMGDGVPGYTWNAAFDWIDRYVAGARHSDPAPGEVRVAPRSGQNIGQTLFFTKFRTESYRSVAAATGHVRRSYLSTAPGAFGFGTKRSLTSAPGPAATTLREGQSPLMTQGFPMYQGITELISGVPTTVDLRLIDQTVTGIWNGPAQRSDVAIRGAIGVHLDVVPTQATGTAFVYALDRGPDGVSRMIGHVPYAWTGATAGRALAVNAVIPYQAYRIPAGHSLAVAVSTGDSMYQDTNPAGSTFQVGPGSYIDLPVK